jgi:hypothetical protein
MLIANRTGSRRVDAPHTWTDEAGHQRSVPQPTRRLKWRYPAVWALRAFVFRRDAFTCQGCCLTPLVPDTYDGRKPLWITEQPRNLLIVDHVIAVKNGGSCHPDNLQAMCETCNAKKSGQDGKIAWDRLRHEDGQR